MVVSDLDPIAGKDLVLPFLPALQEIFSLPCSISCTRDMEKVSFENMQLSTQGAERQRKDILKTALRFEQLLVERRRTSSDMNDSEILAELVTKYNQYRANAAIKKWQVSADGHQAIWAIIIGLDEISRSLIKQHLDHNKWEESGYNEALLKAKRHQLNETVKGCNAVWQAILVVTPEVQHLHIKKYNMWWAMNCRKMKRSMRSRHRWSEENWNRNVDHCCVAVWACNEIAKMNDPRITQTMDYSQDIDAMLIAKPVRMTVESLVMFQDHIGKPLAKSSSVPGAMMADSAEVDEAQEQLSAAEYAVVCASLAADFKEAVAYNLRVNKVLHLRDQIQTGLQLADRCMERRCMMLCTDKPTDSLSTFMRRVVQEASQCFPEAELQCTHHIGYLDTTKYGRLGMPEINEMASWTLRTLNLKPERSSLVFNFTWYVCDYVTPESGTFFSHETGRSLTDKEDGAQWFSAPATIKSILTACLSKVSTVKGQICVIHHYSMYEGAFEKVAIDLMTELQSNAYLACYSETAHPLLFQFALGQVKDKLLEDSLNVQMLEWKGGTGLMGAFSPKFCPEPDQSALMVPRMPELKLCRMVGNGHLEIPQEVRAKWLGDPGLKGICCLVEFNFCVLIQDPDWRVRLKNFDSVFAPTDNPTAAPAPEPVPQDANKDLGQDLPTPERAVDGQTLLTPPALSKEDFDAQYKDCEVKAVTLSVGAQNLTCSIVNDKVYLSTTMNSPSRLLGVQTPSSKPLFLYAGGSWGAAQFSGFEVMRQPCKAKDFLSKEANQNKAVEFRLSSGDELVCLEEQSPQGLVDIGPFTVYKMIVGFEKRA
ncbi:unnamed protein product [Durusdinium trenchii]|uniref:Uncharacterized protein n=1 Tax=Durusdinium trenchii TaxID=1381693 RepID=A0ABP0PUZ5_9DINO